MALRVLLAEDHIVVMQGLRELLEKNSLQVVGQATDGREAVNLAARLRPDLAIMDITMPLLNGVDATREITRRLPRTRVLLLTVHQDDQYVLEALRAGATGYMLKTRAVNELLQAIHEVSRGAIYISPGVSGEAVRAYLNGEVARADALSPREREVLQLIAEGKSTKEVGTVLGISTKTAESHRTRIMGKLDIHEVASLVRYAIRRGLIQA
jgi:two-component system response regulator NreC